MKEGCDVSKIIKKCLVGEKKDVIVIHMATEYEGGNYGDLLARYIVEKLSERQTVKYCENNVYHFCSVGSVLSRNEMCSNTVVWGSGFLSPQATYKVVLTKFRQWLRGKTGHPVYLAVRGKQSRAILLKTGYSCPAVYGDPALVIPYFYCPQPSPKFKLGVILHWSHEKFIPMFSGIEGVKIIPIRRDFSKVYSFIDDISQCECILSSSLHGLILANAYKVPCVRLKIEQNPIATSELKDDFKFEDYLSGLNACKAEPECADYVFSTLFLKSDVKQTERLIAETQRCATKPKFRIDLTQLVHSFPFLAEKYRNKEFKI